MNKLITYVTVCLNSEKYIRQCLESVISQKTSEIEYIVLDGGSKDSTVDIIKEYKKSIDFFRSQSDKGVYFAMNDSIKHAKGNYICFINSDDWLEEFTVKKIIENYENFRKFDVFYGDQNIFDENKKLYKSKANHKLLDYFMSIPHQSAYVKKELYEIISYDEKYKISADYDLFLKLKKLNKIFKKTNFTFSNFRINGMSANKKISSREFLTIQKKYNLSIIAYINYILRYRNFDCFKFNNDS